MSIAVVIAEGALNIPCLTFATVEEAEAFLTKICGPPTRGAWARCITREEVDKMDNMACHFFTSYYEGCGSPFCFRVREVEHGKPFIGWDLN